MRLGIGSDGHAVANRFVDGTGRHVVGVEVAVAGIHAAGDDQAAVRTEHGSQRRPRRPVRRCATPTSGLMTLPPCTS